MTERPLLIVPAGLDLAAQAHLRPGLAVLARARRYASALRQDLWDYAVELARLKEAGLDETDLRLLLALGYLEHAPEVRGEGEGPRRFLAVGGRAFSGRSCFVLTDAGAAHLENLSANPGAEVQVPAQPHYCAELRRLTVGGVLVKSFRQPAVTQETVVAAFEAGGWSRVLPDPLPRAHGLDPQRRLHDTSNSLNRNQHRPLLHFFITGNGRRIGWRLRDEGGDKTTTAPG